MIVLDTNVISALMAEDRNPVISAWISKYDERELYLTATSVAEMLFGISILPEGRRRSRLSYSAALILDRFAERILPFGEDAAIVYAGIAAERRRLGLPIETEDGQIAAICRQHGATLATRNTKDFLHTGVTLIDPWTARDTP